MTTNELVCSSTETNLQEQFQQVLKEITSRMVLPRFLDTPRLHRTGSTPLVSSDHSHGQVTVAPLCSARARRTAPITAPLRGPSACRAAGCVAVTIPTNASASSKLVFTLPSFTPPWSISSFIQRASRTQLN